MYLYSKDFVTLRRPNKKRSGCSTVGSAPRSGRGGRKFESSHPDTIPKNRRNSTSYGGFSKTTGTDSGQHNFQPPHFLEQFSSPQLQ